MAYHRIFSQCALYEYRGDVGNVSFGAASRILKEYLKGSWFGPSVVTCQQNCAADIACLNDSLLNRGDTYQDTVIAAWELEDYSFIIHGGDSEWVLAARWRARSRCPQFLVCVDMPVDDFCKHRLSLIAELLLRYPFEIGRRPSFVSSSQAWWDRHTLTASSLGNAIYVLNGDTTSPFLSTRSGFKVSEYGALRNLRLTILRETPEPCHAQFAGVASLGLR